VSALPLALVQWIYPFNARNAVILVPSLNLLYYNDVSASKVSPGAAPLPTSCLVACLPMLSCLSVLHMCGLGLGFGVWFVKPPHR